MDKYYFGDAKLNYQIQKAIKESDIPTEKQQLILDEIDKLNISAQNMRSTILRIKNVTEDIWPR